MMLMIILIELKGVDLCRKPILLNIRYINDHMADHFADPRQ
jgi:hypothetical protein